MDNIKVFIADNQPLTCIGIITILENFYKNRVEILTFSKKEQLCQKIAKEPPDVVIIDFDLLGFLDIDEFATIRKLSPSTGFLIITAIQEPDIISKLIDKGFSIYILKNCSDQELLNAFDAALSNRKYFGCQVLDIVLEMRAKPSNQQKTSKLTTSEIEVVKLIVQGLTTKEIAVFKSVSFHTVVTHRKNIFRKLSVRSTSELMIYAMRKGMIDSLEYYI